MTERPRRLLVTDLDNTLWDWFEAWYQSFSALVDALVNQVSRINLNTQCRRGPDSFPFTGRKDSAEGTLSVHDALRCFSIRTVVAAQTDNAGKQLVENIVSGRLSSFLSTDYIL